jgi:proteasome alpha subunit
VVAEVGRTPADDEVYRLTYDGSVAQEQRFAVMGGSAEQINRFVAENYRDDLSLQEALRLAVEALGRDSGEGETRTLTTDALEVAILDRNRPRRRFRRIVSPELDGLLAVPDEPTAST